MWLLMRGTWTSRKCLVQRIGILMSKFGARVNRVQVAY